MRFVAFRGGPKDGAVDFYPQAPFPYTLQFPMLLRPLVWPDPDPGTPQFEVCVYRLAEETRFQDHHYGGHVVGVYQHQPHRAAVDRPPRTKPTTAELQRLTHTMYQHPDLRGDR